MSEKTPQYNLEIIAGEISAMRRKLDNVRMHLVVIAIPFWISLIAFLLVVVLTVVGLLMGLGLGGLGAAEIMGR